MLGIAMFIALTGFIQRSMREYHFPLAKELRGAVQKKKPNGGR
jgi:hypothetical protein